MLKNFVGLTLLCSSFLLADTDLLVGIYIAKPPIAAAAKSKKDKTSGIQGIFLTGVKEDIDPKGRPKSTGVHIKDLNVPGGGADSLTQILQPFIGQPVTKKRIVAIKQAIMLYYVSNQKTMIAVEVPQQKTAGGVIQFLVIEKKFGKPIYTGESWYSNERLSGYLGISPGQEIAEDALQNNLSWMNRNPFQSTTMKYVPSDVPNVLDIQFTTKSRRALRFYGRAENTGSATTGFCRFAAGLNWGNALWIGDLFSFEYSTSNEWKRLHSYMANYTSFLPWKHIFSVLASYAQVTPSAEKAQVHAKSAQIRPRYTFPFKPLYTVRQQSITLGLDYKFSNSNVLALTPNPETELIGPPVIKDQNVTQFYGDYTIKDKIGPHSIAFSLDIYWSPISGLVPYQTAKVYESLRPDSRPQYFYTYITAADVITIPKTLTISLLLRGQVASRTLPPTELFGLGGYNTVRGYHQRELSTDNGVVGNIELRTPNFPVFGKDKLLFLAFFDYGLGNNWFVKKPPGKVHPPYTQYLMGVGPGLRYAVNPYLQIRCDYGFKLHHLFIHSASERQLRLGFGQFHVGALGSF